MRTLFSTILVFIGVVAWAQPPQGAGPNLIPNPSFEEVQGKRPKDDLDGSAAFRYNMVAWRSPTLSTPDLKIALPHEVEKAKQSGGKYDEAHTRYKMVAILTHNPGSERSDTYREYIQCKLEKPTKKGEEYYYEFWVCRAARSKYVSNNIGFALSPSPITKSSSWDPLTDIQPDFNYDKVINEDKREWVKISGTLTSANRSNYFILGNFFDNEATNMIEGADPGDFENSYYLIDDIALHEVNPQPDPPPMAPKIEVGTVVKLDRIFFVTAKWDLLPESSEQLNEVVDLLNEYPSMKIAIHGHTDSRGDDSYNENLSRNRAKSVMAFLVDEGGVDRERLEYKGFGEYKPVADNRTAEGRQLNRRVEFVVTELDAENVDVEYDTDVKPYTDND